MSALTQLKLCFALTLIVLIQHAGAQCIDRVGSTGLCKDCGGNCYEDNGCFCSNDVDSCLPNIDAPCNIADLTKCCLEGLYYNSTASCCTETPICVKECAPDEVCEKGQCVCDSSKYQNKTLSDFQPSLLCEPNTMTVTVNKCLLYALGYNSSTIHLRNSSSQCTFPVSYNLNNQSVTDLQAMVEPNWCGNVITADESFIYVNNTIYIDVLSKPLITKNPISFDFFCTYERNLQTMLLLGNITSQTVVLPGINETGRYPLTMAAFKDRAMTQGYTAEDEIVIGTDIFVGVVVQNANGNVYALRIENCTASPTETIDTNSLVFISGGCPAKTDISTDMIENGNSTEARFRISSFQFQSYLTVYLSCNVRLCVKSSGECNKCGNINVRSYDDSSRTVGIRMNTQESFYSGSGKHTAVSWALLAGIQLLFMLMKAF